MTITAIMPEGRQRYYNNDGTPAAGGKLYTYGAGTTNPKPTYSDSSGTTANPNPLTLDAHGEATIYWSGAYKVDLKQADGQQVTGYPVDNLKTDPGDAWNAGANVLAQLAPVGGSDLIGFAQTWAGAVPRTTRSKNQETVSVLDFMKAGRSHTDAAQMAVDTGVRTVLVPAGVQLDIDGTITMHEGQFLQGQGWNTVTGSYNPAAGSSLLYQHATADVPMILVAGGSDADHRERGGLRDIALKHAVEGSTMGTGYKAANARQHILDNVYVASFSTGIEQGENCWQWSMRNVLMMDALKCLFSHDEGEDSTYLSCIFRPYRNGSIAAHLKNMSQTNLFLGCDFSNVTTGVLLEQGDNTGNGAGQPYPMHASFLNCQFENSAAEAIKMVSSNASAAMAKYHPQVSANGCRAFNANSPNQGQIFINAQHASFVEVTGLRSQGYSWGINIGANVGQVLWRPGPGAIFGSGHAMGQRDRIFSVPSCRLQSTALNFVANNFTAVPYTAITSDVAGWYTAPGTIKPALPGPYRAKASVFVQAAPIGRYVLILKTNGGSDATLADFYVSVAGQPLLVSGDLPVVAGGSDAFGVVLYSTASFAVDPSASFFSLEPRG